MVIIVIKSYLLHKQIYKVTEVHNAWTHGRMHQLHKTLPNLYLIQLFRL